MSDLQARPQFGGKVNVPAFYTEVSAVINSMRGKSTLRAICHMLNAMGHRTPRGLEWNKTRLTGFMRNTVAAV